MNKYKSLGQYLANHSKEKKRVTLTLEEMERILGFSLPKSAKNYRTWWANTYSLSRCKDGWLNYGFELDQVELNKEPPFITFKRARNNKKEKYKNYFQPPIKPANFEMMARIIMNHYFKKINLIHNNDLTSRQITSHSHETSKKIFDLVSSDFSVVGEVKYYSSSFSAAYSYITEIVWQLENMIPTKTKHRFIVFGNDNTVPKKWLQKYGKFLNEKIIFYFIEIIPMSLGKYFLKNNKIQIKELLNPNEIKKLKESI